MKVCFITAGPIEWASSRLRAYWVAEALREPGHEVWALQRSEIKHPIEIGGCDAYIWQKTVDLALLNQHKGRHYWDVCDPSWWWQPNECQEIAEHMDGVVASGELLAGDFNEWYGKDLAVCIPDRLKLSHFHTQRQHNDVSPVRLIWFGIAANRIALWGVKATLERLVANGHKIELTILDDRPDVPFKFSDAFPIYHAQWQLSTEVDILSSHDVAVLPRYPGAWGLVKSNNKHLTARACGIPSFHEEDYRLANWLMNHENRQAALGKYGTLERWTIDQSAIQWEELLCS